MLKNTTEGRVILSSSSAINDSTPGRCQPTVELDVPKSIPQARAGDWSFMSFTFQSKNGRAVYVSAGKLRSATRRLYLPGGICCQDLN
ncbi:hypothetical protein ALP30_103377 [Pseudomonas syringae pv. primulae]|nr:hypothetical protein ALP30_103377 [Pseudomonas syringae pv. primulae]